MIFCTSDFVRTIARECARGSYQRELIDGYRRWSGSDCQNRWGARYNASRQSLLARIVERGLCVDTVVVDGMLFLVVAADERDFDSVDSDELLDAWR